MEIFEVLSAPAMRARLIADALSFTLSARHLPGVTRIALIGSITTSKHDPKDVDILVTVTDDADLTPLAMLGRKLQGHALSIGKGGEIFLADPQNKYLGRICRWKVCEFGIRMSCDAIHCARRQYLHDDLHVVKLSDELVASPPIELWPQVVVRVPLPQDVEQGLIIPLQQTQ
ncbi:MAG TPA: hypothetical protein VFB12_22470 [Ktedonobacteraceae bacterium]|nr:hypothetical protein [Ktedonobacteraceae bacterium]